MHIAQFFTNRCNMKRNILLLIFFLIETAAVMAGTGRYTVSGRVLDEHDLKPLPYATVKVLNLELWAITDEGGAFTIANVPEGTTTLEITTLGYVTRSISFTLSHNTDLKNIRLKEDNLSLPGVEVTARKQSTTGTTTYTLDRTTLDHSQVLSLNDIMSLLPGGQTVNSTLMNDTRLALRSSTGERGNAAFGTAIEVDGMRLDNNASMSETQSASTRNVAASNIESVEVIAGIPGVEYGDVSNGVVKVNTRRGHSPWIVEASVNPYTRQVALSKGLTLGHRGGTLNFSLEHARSFADIASPHTAYNRNILSATYSKAFALRGTTLNLTAGLTGNIGGYNSEADPDAFRDTYQRQRDNLLRGNLQLDWLCNTRSAGVFNVNLQAAFSYADKRSESYVNTSSSSSQAYLHTMTDGYAIARDYAEGMGTGSIVLGPTGYWYVRSYNDQKPLSLQLKLKADWTRRLRGAVNRLTVGSELNTSRNDGQGTYYEDMRLAPTWRPYDYSTLPTMRNLALFVENRLTMGPLLLVAGLRDDITMISGSSYGTASSLSPRLNARYNIIKGGSASLTIHAGYGKSVKLPSFQVLYPADTYTDRLVFTPGSTADNKAYYAYYTNVQRALYNSDLKWQRTHQVEAGADATLGKARLSVSAFWSRTYDPYQTVNLYTPFAYNQTSQSALEGCGIAVADRLYSVDPTTGVVTVTSSANGQTTTLPYTTRHTYTSNRQYVNGSPVTRYGLEWVAEMPLVSNRHTVGLSLRFDGNYYHYRGVDRTLIAGAPNGVGDQASTSGQQPLIGYYVGSNITSASAASTPSVSNGVLNKSCSMNTTLTARMPRLRLVMTMRLETTFLNYRRNLSENRTTIALDQAGDVTGTPYDGQKDHYVAVYPEFYSTWDNPTARIPFAEALLAAKDSDPALYRQLSALIVRSNTAYYFNPQRVSAYCSANFSVTKEIGRWVSLSFYANNFFNNMAKVRNTQTGLETSLFNSGYIPKFYYGASVRIKL